MRLLIGFTGNMGSGKSLAADFVATRYNCTKMRLSGKMREIASDLEVEPTRDFLQGIGKFMREFDDDVWVRYVYKQVLASQMPIVLDDIRRTNEIMYLRPLGFKFIRLDAKSEFRKARIEERGALEISHEDWKRWAEHLTENQVKDLPVDYIIENNGSKIELKQKLDEIVSKLLSED